MVDNVVKIWCVDDNIVKGVLCLIYAIFMVARFMSLLKITHWNVAKWIFRYIEGTIECKIKYNKDGDFIMGNDKDC
jgi:hypothetical protein